LSGVVNNDKLAEVFTALLFWLIVKIFKRGFTLGYFSAYLITMMSALLSKRTAIFVMPLFLIMLLLYFWQSSLGIRFHLVVLIMFSAIILGGNSLAWYLHDTETLLNKFLIWMPPKTIHYLFSSKFLSLGSLKFFAKFCIVMYWSFWGVFGYMTIHLHHFWYLAAALFQLLSIGGLMKIVWDIRRRKSVLESWKIKVLYFFGASIVLLAFVLVARSILLRPSDPVLAQGRRFFTVIIPISCLTLLGLQQCFAPKYHRIVGMIGVIGLVVLDTAALSRYLLLNFYGLTLF
jgi:hypothetical protein